MAAPRACGQVRPSRSSSASHACRSPGPCGMTTCSTSQLSSPRPQAQTSTSIRSFCTSAPAVRKRPPAGTVPGRPFLAPVGQPLPVRRLAGLDPGLAEHGVAEDPLGLVAARGRLLVARDVGPALPARRRIERRQVEADRPRILRHRRRPPFARGQHRRLVVLGDDLIAVLAPVRRRLRPALLPAQPLEAQPLHRPAMRARHEVAPLVGGLVLPLDAADAPDRRRRHQEQLPPVREGQRPRLGEPDRVAFLVGRGRIGVDLVEEHVARRHRAQAHRRVRARHDQHAAREILRELRVAAVARARRADQLAERRALLDQRLDALARVPLGELDRRLHRQHRPRRMVDAVANEAVSTLRGAHLRRLHEDDALRRVAMAQRVHDRPACTACGPSGSGPARPRRATTASGAGRPIPRP